jgi:hypothetical protein
MKRYRKILLVLSAAAVILFSANLLTSAWLVDSTQEEINTFIPGTVTTTVEEEFDGETKDNVFIRNTGNIDAYIRAAVIPVWKTESGDLSGTAVTAADFPDLPILPGWFKGTDGFYYHIEMVAPGALTEKLIGTFEMPMKEGLKFELQIIGSGIQADPPAAVTEMWGITVNPDKTLQGGGP